MLQQALTDLHTEGFALVPIVRGEKRPEHDGWQKREFKYEDFTDSHNVGVKCGAPSGHKVDVDLDAPEAVRAADLLPFTRVHGRPGKPHSHHWFVCADLKQSLQFKDPVSGAMLCELRGTGGQTVVPPSTHPSGDALVWENRRPYLVMSAADLQRAVAEVATVALFARQWPSGSRHVAALHLGGFLARLGIDAPQVERMVRLMAQIAGDDEVADRARAARESAEKHERGDKTTGAPSIVEHFGHGAALVKAVYSWFGRNGDDEIDEMNTKHFVALLGSSMVVGTERDDTIIYQTFASFKERYCNRLIGKQPLGDAWLKHPQRREYDNVVFAPPGTKRTQAGPRDYNIWRGFAVAPDPNPHPEDRCRAYLEHVYAVIADYNETHGDYVLDLMADVVQQPGRLIGKTLALRGGQGLGKSVFVESFGWLFGKRHFTILNNREQLVGQFNGHLSGKIVLFADEAIWGGNKADQGTLKRIVTQDTFTIRRLYVDAINEPNFIHLFMATNGAWVWNADKDDRRLVILDVNPVKQSQAYFDRLWAEVESPGFSAALLATLLARKVDETRLREGLNTKALVDVKGMSAEPLQQWWRQVLDEGQLFPWGEEAWPDFAPCGPMYDRYCVDMGHSKAGHRNLGTRWQFTRQLRQLLPEHPASTRKRVEVNVARDGNPPQMTSRQEPGYPLPALQACRDHYDTLTGGKTDWSKLPIETPQLPDVSSF